MLHRKLSCGFLFPGKRQTVQSSNYILLLISFISNIKYILGLFKLSTHNFLEKANFLWGFLIKIKQLGLKQFFDNPIEYYTKIES